MSPSAGGYKLYWRNPANRVFEAVPGISLQGNLAGNAHLALTTKVKGKQSTTLTWYTNHPGATEHRALFYWTEGFGYGNRRE